MTQDGLAVTEYLIRHLGKTKIILVGGSWGSILGVHMVKSRPGLFYAYVGFAQVVSYRESVRELCEGYRRGARIRGPDHHLGARRARHSPWKNPRNYGILRRATRVYEARTTDPAPESWWVRSPDYDTPEIRDSHLEGEDFSYLQFVGLQGEGMFSRVDLPVLGSEFQGPVFIAQGAEDLVTVPDVGSYFYWLQVLPSFRTR